MYAAAGVKTSKDFLVPDMMKAWVLGDPGELKFVDKPVPVPKKAEVLVRIDAVAICATVYSSGMFSFIHRPIAPCEARSTAPGSGPSSNPDGSFARALSNGRTEENTRITANAATLATATRDVRRRPANSTASIAPLSASR